MARTRRRVLLFTAPVAMLLLVVAQSGFASSAASGAAGHLCEPTDQTTQTVAGTTVSVDSAFHCPHVADNGTYEVTVTVANAAASATAIRVDDVVLSHTTPRPRGEAPDATAAMSDVPVTVRPGADARLVVTGDYTLVSTDEGAKANLHLQLSAHTANSGEPVALGVTMHLRAPDVAG